jgi:hypothetical protein
VAAAGKRLPSDDGRVEPQLSEAPLANVVDVNLSALAKIAKTYLPPAAAYDGMHRHLRELATHLPQ